MNDYSHYTTKLYVTNAKLNIALRHKEWERASELANEMKGLLDAIRNFTFRQG